jgi:RNA-binding protein
MTLGLSGKQRRHLRGLGHALAPILQIGKEGLSDAFVAAVERALGDHELVKIRVLGNAPHERHEAGEELAGLTTSELVQVLGNSLLLYRPHPDEPKLELPDAGGAGAKAKAKAKKKAASAKRAAAGGEKRARR